ncbi:putative leucine-rich repeat-containing protein DDB_G0290503 [Frieseomelitta varia]|uniref:putative leucine-rich repeat-containing protein DDB_G0290503 n=1 Tax=Frieseomelitta varia TaxID=561572 RepID=UPI001CB69C6F|nr:putative leucine-rich repeat-containing protein DDB_G0290503 [Frieseomelitta varia]
MIPFKSTRNSSRRSSILKPPKPRHPLQNLNFSSSSNENSPTTTTKIKRRVSFAEKKHVKEFCNSLEQGTVWNNTYEENDLSNLKIPCSSNQKECEIESIFKENFFDNHENDAQSDYNKVMEENVNSKEDSLHVINVVKNVNCQDEMLMTEPLITLHDAVVEENKSISLTNLQLDNDNHISKSITVYEDCNRKLNEKMSKLSNHNDLNTKSVKKICTDLTKVVCNNICFDVNYIKNTVTEKVPENVSMELTQIILPSENIQNMSMELTVPLLSVINDNINNVKMTTCENDRTKNFHNISMEMTTAVSMCNLQSNSNYCVDNDNKTTFFNDVQDEKTKLLNTSMEVTSVVPTNTHTKICTKEVTDPNNPENSTITKLSQCEYNIAKQDEKTKLLNTSMEVTSVVPTNTHTKICTKEVTDPNNPENSTITKLSQCEYNIAKQDEKTKLLNTSMEVTSVVPTNTHTKICTKEVTDPNNPENSTITKLSQCEYNIAKQDEKTKLLNTSMEITSVVPANAHTKIHREDTTNLNSPENNIKKLRIDPIYETLANLSRTRMYSSESMEFTTDVATSPKIRVSEHQNNLQTTIQNTSYTQSNSASIFGSCNSHISSNKTIIFQNNSTFTNILPLDVRDNSGKARVTDCETNINENIAIVTTQSQTEINSDTDSIKIRQSVLSDNIQNRDLADFTTCTDNILKDITTIAIPCTLSSETVSDEEKFIDKENNFSKRVENVLDKSNLIKLQNSVNVTSSMGLHESVQQDIFVSGLRKNTEVPCTTYNSMSNDFFSAVNSKLNKDKDKHAQTITSHPRRTYTIQSLDSNHTFTISNKENTNVLQINDNNFGINNQENNVLNSEKCLQKNENYNEECPINKSDIIFNENVEILESIKTPTFYCLDDLSDIDQSINVNCNQEINCFSKNRNDEHEDTSNFNDYQADILDENVRKSCTFMIKCASSNSKLDQVQADEIQKLELLDVRNTNIKSQIIKCSSPIMNDTEKLSQTFDVEENIQDLCLNNSNFENQNIQCLSNVRAMCENTLKVNDDDKSVDINRMKMNKESYTNEKLEQCLKTHTCIEGNVAIELNLFSFLMNELKDYTKSDEIIWEIYHENIEKNMFIAGFISCSLLVVIFIRDLRDVTNNEFIKDIKLISRLADDADVLMNIVHRIILEKLDVKKLLDLYKNREDILLMLDFISKEVKLAMDFMFELKCLNDLNLMEITRDRISFVSQTRTGNIILEITIDIKPFDKIEPRNISIHCLMGSVREEDVKKLIMNIKRDHKFLRKYINDVKDYIYLVEESVI